jgi:hypothetical protein
MYQSLGPLARFIANAPWPIDFFSADDLPGVLNHIYVLGYRHQDRVNGLSLTLWLAVDREVAFRVPGLEGVSIVAGSPQPGYTIISPALTLGHRSALELRDVSLALRFDPQILKPASFDGASPTSEHAEIQLKGRITITDSFDVGFEGFDTLRLPPAMVGDSGIVIAADDVKLDLSRTGTLPEIVAAGFDEGFVGVYLGDARVRLPEGLPALVPEDLLLRNCAIGSGGVSGQISAQYPVTYDPAAKAFSGPGAGQLFGIPFGLQVVDVRLRRNTFEASRFAGRLLLPFFEEPVDVELGLNLDGSVSARLANAEGIVELEKPGVLRVRIDSIGFEAQGTDFVVRLSGTIKLLYGGIDWPEVEVRELSIDRDGHVRIEGGWLDLPRSASLDFNGFAMELHRIGFGKSGNRNWIGFSGDIRLVEQLSFGASVEGLKVLWDSEGHVDFQMSAIAVELTVPEVLSFTGRVEYIEEADVKGFKGDVGLTLNALETTFDASLMVGRHTEAPVFNFAYVYINAQLPAGIPLAQTNLAIYGFAGLLGTNVAPDKPDTMDWFQWYSGPPVGATATSKWHHDFGSQALGAGLTLGTAADNGYAFSTKAILVVIFPGPLLLIDGKANLLEDRSKLDGTTQGQHRALAVIDRRAGTFLVNLQPTYKYDPPTGAMIQITGPAEAFFDYNHPDAWHVYIGEAQPLEKRIRARILKGLLNADAYVMLDRRGMRLGAGAGLDREYDFGRLSVALRARIEGQADVSWRPIQMDGTLSYEAVAELRAFGSSASVFVDTQLEVQTPHPYHVYGRFRVRLRTPWPLPDPSARVTLEWGNPDEEPTLASVLGRMAAEHLKVMDTWDLRLGSDLVEATVPTIPLDARILISFNRPIADEALVGCNAGSPPRPERVGSVEVLYELRSIVLERKTDDWNPVESRVDGEGSLFGMWLPLADKETAAGKLQLWSPSPFTYGRHSGRGYVDRFLEDNPGYPCATREPAETLCVGFADIESRLLPSIFIVGDLIFEFAFTDKAMQPRIAVRDGVRVLSLIFKSDPVRLRMTPSEPAAMVQVKIAGAAPGASLTAYGEEGLLDSQHTTVATETVLTVKGEGIEHVELDVDRPTTNREVQILEVCFVPQSDHDRAEEVERVRQHLRGEMTAASPPWCGKGHLLETNSLYRLSVTTATRRWRDGSELAEEEVTEVTHFQTAGPPGDLPTDGPLRDLSSYIDDAASSPRSDASAWYGAYDLRIAFNENYVERLYDGNGRPLSVALLDRNAAPARDSSGTAVEIAPVWDTEAYAPPSAADRLWLWTLQNAAEAGCGPMTSGDCIAKPDTLVIQLPARSLAPRQLVEVSLSALGAAVPLHRRRFTSSRFATFTHHIHSFQDAAWDHLTIAALGTNLLVTAEDATALSDIVRAKRDEHPGFDLPWEAAAFEDLAQNIFTLGQRALPDRLEITVLRDAQRSYGLLLESPEPLEWRRTSVAIHHAPAMEAVDGRPRAALKIIGGSLASADGADFNEEWIDVLALADADLSGVTIEYAVSGAGSTANHYTFGPQPPIAMGTTVRVHAGAPPAGTTPASERVMRYATASGEQPIWRLSPSGGIVSLVDGNNAAMHRAEVRPGATFQAVPHVVIRSADQTRSLIFFTTSSDPVAEVPQGVLRFDWMFLRDLGPGAPLLTRRGSTAAEQTAIEFHVPAQLPPPA